MKRLFRLLPFVLMGLLALALGCKTAPAPAPAAPTTAPPAPAATTAPAAAQPTTAPAQPTAAPAAAKAAPQPKNAKGTIVHGESARTCAPGLSSTNCEFYISQAWGVIENMFTWRRKADGTIDYEVGQIAVKWDMAPDAKKVVIETRQGVNFHKKGGDWGQMTAEDVAWSYNQVNPKITPYSIAPSASYFSTLFGANPAKALDANHVEYIFASVDTHWNSYMMNGNGFVGLGIHPKKAYDTKGEDWMKENVVGTGPFMVDSWIRDDRIVLSKTDMHWEHKPLIDKFIIQVMPEDSTRVAALQTGELDSSSLAIKSVPRMQAEGFKTTLTGNANQAGIMFSGNLWEDKHALTGEDLQPGKSPVYVRDLEWLGNPWTPNDGNNPQELACAQGVTPLAPSQSCGDMEQARLVRWAVGMAIDRNAINSKLLNNLGWPVHVPYADEKSQYWDKKWEYPYDVAKANEFLDKAGFKKGANGVRFEMPMFVNSGAYAGIGDEIGDAFSGMMSGIGIKSGILKFPYAVFRPDLVGRTATIPRLTAGDDGQAVFPFDWQQGIEESSLSRGGYCMCYEAPEISRVYLAMGRELDKQKRIELKKQYFDYMHFWALKTGVVAIPVIVTYNPNSIKEWVMEPTPFASGSLWKIVPAR